MNASHNVLTEAVRLLVDMAGTEPVHIEMSARGPRNTTTYTERLTSETDALISSAIVPKEQPCVIQVV